MDRREAARRSRRPEERARDHPDERPVRSEAAERVLALQRGAGNHAVSRLLARAPETAKPKEKEKPGSAEDTGARATLPGIGTISLISLVYGTRGLTGSPHAGREEDKSPPFHEITCTSRVGDHSAQLFKASLEGTPMAVEVTLARGPSTLRLKLESAIVSSYTTSNGGGGPLESWKLSFASVEQSSEGDPGK